MSAIREKNASMLVNLGFNVVLPSVFLMKGSKWFGLDPLLVLAIALAFPFAYGVYEFGIKRKSNTLSIIGFVSILLTGVIGLIQLSKEWLIVKEAAVPLAIGLFILFSFNTRFSLLPLFIYNPELLNVDAIQNAVASNKKEKELQQALCSSNKFLGYSFFLSAVLNLILAYVLLKNPTGTPEFVEELGRLTALSYPFIALPCTIICAVIVLRLIKLLEHLTGLNKETLFR